MRIMNNWLNARVAIKLKKRVLYSVVLSFIMIFLYLWQTTLYPIDSIKQLEMPISYWLTIFVSLYTQVNAFCKSLLIGLYTNYNFTPKIYPNQQINYNLKHLLGFCELQRPGRSLSPQMTQ